MKTYSELIEGLRICAAIILIMSVAADAVLLANLGWIPDIMHPGTKTFNVAFLPTFLTVLFLGGLGYLMLNATAAQIELLVDIKRGVGVAPCHEPTANVVSESANLTDQPDQPVRPPTIVVDRNYVDRPETSGWFLLVLLGFLVAGVFYVIITNVRH